MMRETARDLKQNKGFNRIFTEKEKCQKTNYLE